VAAPQTILLAEDNPDDVTLIDRAFKQAGFKNPLEVVRNGAQALQYLKGEGRYANRELYPVPALLLLDLKMPLIDGFEVLAWVRNHPEWNCLPVVVLTTSFYGPDIDKAYDLGANSFVTKSVDLEEFIGTVRQLCKFWLHDTKLPTPGPFVPAPSEETPPTPHQPANEHPRRSISSSHAHRPSRKTANRKLGARSVPP
jgi:two-component system response regulator